jgi:hypothetical protein
MIEIPGGDVNDEENKGLVVETVDGLYAVTYCGIGRIRRKRVDLWLADLMLDEGVPEIPLDDSLGLIARSASKWFASIPKGIDKRHTFVVAGWHRASDGVQPRIHFISNCWGDNYTVTSEAREVFAVRTNDLRRKGAFVATGQHRAISRAEKHRLKRALASVRSLEETESHLVRTVRDAATHPKMGYLVGKDVMSIAISPEFVALATLHPNNARPTNYAPVHVWNAGPFNVMAGDAIIRGTDYVYKFGRTVVATNIPAPGQLDNPSSLVENWFRSRVVRAKFNRSEPTPEDSFSLVEAIPVSDRAKNARWNTTPQVKETQS